MKTIVLLVAAALLSVVAPGTWGQRYPTKPIRLITLFAPGGGTDILARKGFTANSAAFEHKQGYFNVFNGPGNYDADRILEGWANPFDIVNPGASYKIYPCCYSTHAAVEAALDLARKHGPFDADSIVRVDSWIPGRGLAHTDRPQPNSTLDAKFSVQYCVARALLDGKLALEHFEGDAYCEPAIREFLQRVHASPYVGKLFSANDPFDAEVKVILADGATHAAHVDRPLGRTADNPIPIDRIRAKFEDCAMRALAPAAVAAAARAIEALDEAGSVRDLTAVLEAGFRTCIKKTRKA